MNQDGKREFFAGSNSYYGFWPYFDSIAMSPQMTRLLIKGGPGFGKSTMIKKIGAYFAKKGFQTEWFRCPSDPDSMDAVAVPQAGFCIIDATAPHALVPTRPNDEILNLWQYWNADQHGRNETDKGMTEYDTEKTAGIYEKWLHQTRQEWEIQEQNWWADLEKDAVYPMVQRELEQQTQLIEEQLFQNTKNHPKNAVRHLFAAGFTPDGVIHLSPEIFHSEWQYIGINCSMQPIAEQFMKRLAQKCPEYGVETEIYHSPADPQKVDIVALPQSKKAVVLLNSFGIQYEVVLPSSQILMKIELCKSAQNQKDLSFTKKVDVQRITDYLYERRQHHQLAEKRYLSAMDYEGINQETERIIQRFDQTL